MKPVRRLTALPDTMMVTAAIAGFAVVRAGSDAFKALRQNPGPVPAEPLPAAFLKHSDEQSIAGLSAVFQAIHDHGLGQVDFTRWGVLAAPRFLARGVLAQALKRFAQEGAWGVSPHLIPHRSLHSVSGTVSQALKIHGPNFGVGGGPGGVGKALLAASAALACDQLPGVWVVVTGWNWEPLEGASAADRPPAVCSAAAIALVLDGAGTRVCGRMHVCASGALAPGEPIGEPLLTLESLCDALERHDTPSFWRMECGGHMELEKVGILAEKRS